MSERLLVDAFMCGVCGRRWAHIYDSDGLVLVQSQRERRCCEPDADAFGWDNGNRSSTTCSMLVYGNERAGRLVKSD